MTNVSVGQTVRLKPNRAQAYGLASSRRYTITMIHERTGYKVPWVTLDTGAVVRRTELVAA